MIARLNTSGRKYMAWKENWNIWLTVAIIGDSEILKQNILEIWVFAF